MGLGPLSLYGAGSPFIIRGWVPFQSQGLGPRSSNGAGSPFKQWGWIPLLFCGAGSPCTVWGWMPLNCVGLGPLAINWREDLLQIPSSLEHLSTFYGAQHVWFCPTADPDLRGWVPVHCVGLGPLSSNGAGSPLNQWGRIPLYCVGLDPLLLCGAGSTCNRLAGGSIADTWLPGAPIRLLRRTACVVLSHC